MRLLITGAAGMLGQDACSAAGGHELVALSHADLDITEPAAVNAAVAQAAPDVVINCAAWTDVDGAERSTEAAFAANGKGAGNIAQAANACGAWTIHISSDYVFDGSKRQPYVESDPVKPLSAYGASKLAGERAVAAAAPETHTIVRSSWLFGTGGPCFPATIARLASERDELTVVDDQVGCPTFTGHLARALIELCSRAPLGVTHVAAAGSCSWFEFALEIVERTGLRCEVLPGSTAQLARPAPRPAYSVLGTERGPEVPVLPRWSEGLGEFLATAVSSA